MRALLDLREDYFRRGYGNKAASSSQDLIETTTKALGEDHELPVLANIGSHEIDWSSRRWLWGYFGPRRALELNLDLVRVSQRVLGNEHPTILQFVPHTAKHLLLKKYLPEAIALGEQIIELTIRGAGADHPDIMIRLTSLESAKAIYWWCLRCR